MASRRGAGGNRPRPSPRGPEVKGEASKPPPEGGTPGRAEGLKVAARRQHHSLAEAMRQVEGPRGRRTRSHLAGPEAGAGKRVCLLRPPPRRRRPPPASLRRALPLRL